jgi:hypothetical protein
VPLLIAQLRVLVNIPPPSDQLVFDGRNARTHGALERVPIGVAAAGEGHQQCDGRRARQEP